MKTYDLISFEMNLTRIKYFKTLIKHLKILIFEKHS